MGPSHLPGERELSLRIGPGPSAHCIEGCERSGKREFLGRRNDTGVETSTARRECRVRDAQEPPGSRSPPSAEPWSREGEFHWKNSKTRGIQWKFLKLHGVLAVLTQFLGNRWTCGWILCKSTNQNHYFRACRPRRVCATCPQIPTIS